MKRDISQSPEPHPSTDRSRVARLGWAFFVHCSDLSSRLLGLILITQFPGLSS